MRPHSRSLHAVNQSVNYSDANTFRDTPEINKSNTISTLMRQTQSSLQKSRSNTALNGKDKMSISFREQNASQNTNRQPQAAHMDLKLVVDHKIDNKWARSLNASPNRSAYLTHDSNVTRNKSKTLTKTSIANNDSKLKTTRPRQLSYVSPDKKGVTTSQTLLDAEKNVEKKQPNMRSGVNSRENSPMRNSVSRTHMRKPASFDDSSLKSILKKNAEDGQEKSPKKEIDKQITFEEKESPVFFFNIGHKQNMKKMNTQGSMTLKDKIKQKILDLVDPNEFKITSLPSGKQREVIESHRIVNNSINDSQLLNLIPMDPTLYDEEKTKDFQRQLDDMRSSIANVLGEPVKIVPSSSPNISYLSFNGDIEQKESSLKRQNSWNNLKKSQVNTTNTTKSTLLHKRTIDDSIEETTNGQRSRNSDFSFKMTYFKPIDDSTLDEFIQGTNLSRTIKASVTPDTQASLLSPSKKKSFESMSNKVTKNILNQSQDLTTGRESPITKQKKADLRSAQTTPKKWDVRSPPAQKSKNSTASNTSFKLSSVFQSSASAQKADLDKSKGIIKKDNFSTKQPILEAQKSITYRDGFTRHRKSVGSIESTSREYVKPRSGTNAGLKASNTYTKLDKLLQDLKNNSMVMLPKEELETGPDGGLFAATEQVLDQNQDVQLADSVINQSFRKAFVCETKK